MKLFTKQESKVIIVIFTILFLVIGYNMIFSLRRGRDSVRKDDLSALQKSLNNYYQKYKIYPTSTDNGLIVGCFENSAVTALDTGYPINAIPCIWGESYFENVNLMPRDPLWESGASYKYTSDGKSYFLFISLENHNEVEYTQSIVDKNLQCGTKVCNYGRGN